MLPEPTLTEPITAVLAVLAALALGCLIAVIRVVKQLPKLEKVPLLQGWCTLLLQTSPAVPN